jgi:glycosyltransferase involved in cell wall biosynthesis
VTAPRVSIVIACYNLGAYVDDAVESVLAQTLRDVEVLVIDDGSTDSATRARLARYRRPKTRVISTAHGGVAAARNRGIRESRGEYLCALDADDKLAPRYLERAVDLLDRDPSIAFVSSWLEAFGAESWLWSPDACDLPILLAEDTVHGSAVVRRSVVLEVGGYDETLHPQGYEDWDLWLQVVERGHRGTILPEVGLYYRRRPGSRSAIYRRDDVHLTVMQELIARHAESYRTHLLAVLAHMESEIGRWLGRGYDLERELALRLTPQVEALRREVRRLETKLAGRERAEERLAVLEGHAARLEQEVLALRGSMSWRITAPLRVAYGALRRLARREG